LIHHQVHHKVAADRHGARIDKLAAFPRGVHDDQVDALSRALAGKADCRPFRIRSQPIRSQDMPLGNTAGIAMPLTASAQGVAAPPTFDGPRGPRGTRRRVAGITPFTAHRFAACQLSRRRALD
jgi:hypothetical protein